MENSRSRLENSDRYRLGSLHHVLDVLEYLGDSERPVSVTEVAKATGLVKSGTFRILHNLEQRGYVRKDADSQYSLGLRLWRLARTLTQVGALRERARPVLLSVTAATGETTHLAVLDRLHSVYIDKAETPASIRAYADIGDYAPAHAVATGKVLLAALPRYELDPMLTAPLERYTPTTTTEVDDLLGQLAEIRTAGFALNDGEWREEVVGVAVPVHLPDGTTIALGAAGPRYRFPPERARAHLPLLRAKARELHAQLT